MWVLQILLDLFFEFIFWGDHIQVVDFKHWHGIIRRWGFISNKQVPPVLRFLITQGHSQLVGPFLLWERGRTKCPHVWYWPSIPVAYNPVIGRQEMDCRIHQEAACHGGATQFLHTLAIIMMTLSHWYWKYDFFWHDQSLSFNTSDHMKPFITQLFGSFLNDTKRKISQMARIKSFHLLQYLVQKHSLKMAIKKC